jgi:tRNA splicing ligase
MHVTLATRNGHPELFHEYHSKFQEQKALQRKEFQKNQKWQNRSVTETARNSQASVHISIKSVHWDDYCMVLKVELPRGLACGNEVPHITLSLLNADMMAAYANQVFRHSTEQLALNGSCRGWLKAFT